MNSLRQIDALVDVIIDMYIPLRDISNMSCDLHCDRGKLLAVECEEIVSHILNLITIFIKYTSCIRNKDILKHYYKKYRVMTFSSGKVEEFTSLDIKLQETLLPADMEISILKMSSNFKALEQFISEFDLARTFFPKVIFIECLKKLECCMMMMIKNLNWEKKMKDVVSSLEHMYATIAFQF